MTITTLPALWPHQEAGIRFAAERKTAYFNVWMRLGKTRMAIETCRAWEATTVLVVAPRRVISTWVAQFEKFSPQGPWSVLGLNRGTTAQRGRITKDALSMRGPLVVVTNYEAMWRSSLAKTLRGHVWDAVVYDEAHRLKAPGGRASRFAASLMARHRLMLSGTMFPHSPLDAYGQWRALDKRVFGTNFVAFRNEYAVMVELGNTGTRVVKDYKNVEQLRAKIAPYVFQAGKECLDILPTTDEVVSIELEPKGMRAYTTMERFLCAQLKSGEVTAANGLVKYLRLQQITSGYLTPDEGGDPEEVSVAKREWLETLLDGLPSDEPVVVFCRFTSDLANVHRVAEKLKRGSLELSGARDELEKWQASEGGLPILAVQIQSGGEGVDMTRARYCVFYSLGFSLKDYLQARERVSGPDQTRHAVYYHLVARDTIDEAVYKALEKRQTVVDAVTEKLMDVS